MVEIERQKASLIAEIERSRAAFRSATAELNASLDIASAGKAFVAKYTWPIVGAAVGAGILTALIGSRGNPLSKIGSSVVAGTTSAAKSGIKALLLNAVLSAVQPTLMRFATEKLTAILEEKGLNLFKPQSPSKTSSEV